MSIEDIAVQLRNKADVELIGSKAPHIITTLDYGIAWARLYSDGFCIQGGIFGKTRTDYAIIKKAFLIPFKNTKYVVLTNSGHNGDLGYPALTLKTTGCFESIYMYNNFGNANWIAFGYAKGEF